MSNVPLKYYNSIGSKEIYEMIGGEETSPQNIDLAKTEILESKELLATIPANQELYFPSKQAVFDVEKMQLHNAKYRTAYFYTDLKKAQGVGGDCYKFDRGDRDYIHVFQPYRSIPGIRMIASYLVQDGNYNDTLEGRDWINKQFCREQNSGEYPVYGIGINYGWGNKAYALCDPSIWLEYIKTIACIQRGLWDDDGHHFRGIIQTVDVTPLDEDTDADADE